MDLAVMFLCDLVANGKSETRTHSYAFGGKSGIKYVIQLFRGYALAGIGKFDGDVAFMGQSFDCDGSLSLDGLFCIDQKIDKDLVQLAFFLWHSEEPSGAW